MSAREECRLLPSVGSPTSKTVFYNVEYHDNARIPPPCVSPDREFSVENVDFVTDKDEDETNV